MESILPIPRTLKTDKKGFDFLSCLYNDVKNMGNVVVIDFSTCYDIDGNLAAVLGAVFDKLISEGIEIKLTHSSYQKVKRSLGRNHFFEAWGINSSVQDKENYIVYKTFKDGSAEEFKKYIKHELIQKQRFPKHTELVETKLIESVYEIYANAITHSNSDSVTCCGEFDETDQVLHLTIVDCGTTIPCNVNNYFRKHGKHALSSCDAIEWAFEDGHTTKPKEKEPGGLGLGILRDFIELNRGTLDLVSGKGHITLHGKELSAREVENSFPGTIINMNFNFNDSSVYYLESEEEEIDINNLL